MEKQSPSERENEEVGIQMIPQAELSKIAIILQMMQQICWLPRMGKIPHDELNMDISLYHAAHKKEVEQRSIKISQRQLDRSKCSCGRNTS